MLSAHATSTSNLTNKLLIKLLIDRAYLGRIGFIAHQDADQASCQAADGPLIHGAQVGAGGIKSLAGGRTVMSMEDILEMLVAKARVEAEDSQRQLLGALNGIAALMQLLDDPAEAVATYRQALTLSTPCNPSTRFLTDGDSSNYRREISPPRFVGS